MNEWMKKSRINVKQGKVTLFNVGSSFSYEAGINGSWRCALYPPPSVSAPLYRYLKLLSYADQRKVETDVEIPEDRTGDGRYKTQVTGHCFTNTESILNSHKS